MRAIHIQKSIEKLDNYMFCGRKNPEFTGHTYVSPYELEMGMYTLEGISCVECREFYILGLLAAS